MLAEKLEMAGLASEVVETTRTYYQHNECYPSLRRVQYVYENTEDDNPMREVCYFYLLFVCLGL